MIQIRSSFKQIAVALLAGAMGIGLIGCIPANPLAVTNQITQITVTPVAISSTVSAVVTPMASPLAMVTTTAIDDPTTALSDATVPATKKIFVWVLAPGQNIYPEPDPAATVLSKLARGAMLQVLEQSSDAAWLKVETVETVIGWVSSKAVRLNPENNLSASVVAATPRVNIGQTIPTVVIPASGTAQLAKTKPTPRAVSTLLTTTSCDNGGSQWFFVPHPKQTLRHYRVAQITQQTFASATLYWIHELNQTWALFTAGSWTNRGGDIKAVSTSLGDRIGIPISRPITYSARVGDTLVGNHVTAYVLMPSQKIVRWTIDAHAMKPLDWSVLDTAVACL